MALAMQTEILKLYFVTWNVATRYPEQSLHRLLGLNDHTAPDELNDIYVIGLQEVKSQPQNIVLDTFFEDPWTKSFREILKKYDYVNIRTQRLQGLVLNIFSLRKHVTHIRSVDSQYTKIGFGGLWGNKGAVSVRFEMYGVNLCLLNAHLTPHDHLLASRIADYSTIIKEHLYYTPQTVDIFSHDYVFWIGDLNFRLIENMTREDIDELLNKNKLDILLENDQLKISMKNGTAFSEFVEETITFPPTYKYEFASQEFNSKRRPSWTDRILYKVNKSKVNLKAVRHNYKSHSIYVQSDHKPVTSEFEIKINPMVVHDEVEIEPINTWFMDEENSITLNFSSHRKSNPEDWVGLYDERFCSINEYLVYEYVNRGKNENLSEQEEPVKRIFFGASAVTSVGMHRIVYISQIGNVMEILGMTPPFLIRKR